MSATQERTFTVTGIDFSGYMVQDARRAIAFYREVLGLEPARYYPDDRGAEFDLRDGTTFGLWGGGGKVMPFQPSNGILFAVDDFEAAAKAVKERGLRIAFENELPTCFMIAFPDTEGNLVFLHKRKPT
jgi:predicted enzyme related to lactoylglutathione lyase